MDFYLRQEILQLRHICYLLQKLESVLQIGAGALLIVSKYILGLIWGNDSMIYLFDSNSKDENGNL